jgi:glycosyltransferase involved in cell wall biosynthesis
MRVLFLHNYYKLPGGEDLSFEAEADLLERRGHEVIRFTVRNDDIERRGKLVLAAETFWNRRVYADLKRLAETRRPHVAHFHNTFPRLSPAAFYAVRRTGAAIVETVQNYRLFCANALLFRRGQVCEDCVGRRAPWLGVLYGCYRGSRSASAVVAGMLALHRALGTWERAVDVFVAPSEFTEQRLTTFAFRRAVVRRKVNFVDPDPGAGPGGGNYALFVGRLSSEKGLETLLAAWRVLSGEMPLRIVGSGPLATRLTRTVMAGVEFLGQREHAEVLSLIARATCVVVPSLWFEGLPRVVIEAYACGTPVLASRIGALEEVVHHEQTGLLFRAGESDDLVRTVRHLLADPGRLAGMRRAARCEFEATYTADRNYERLLEIYELARAKRMARE